MSLLCHAGGIVRLIVVGQSSSMGLRTTHTEICREQKPQQFLQMGTDKQSINMLNIRLPKRPLGQATC